MINKKVLFGVILPVLFGLAFLVFTIKKIDQANKELASVEEQKATINQQIATVEKQLEETEMRFKTIDERYNSWKWVADVNSTKEALAANEHINQLLGTDKVDPWIVIRHYHKRSDRLPENEWLSRGRHEALQDNRVISAIQRTPFRDVYMIAGDYDIGDPSCALHYGSKISNDEIVYLALVMLREGIDLKTIEPYPSSVNKPNFSMEISASCKGDKNLTVDEVIGLKWKKV